MFINVTYGYPYYIRASICLGERKGRGKRKKGKIKTRMKIKRRGTRKEGMKGQVKM